MSTVSDNAQLRKEWVQTLVELVDEVESWAKEFGWSTRRIEITLNDSRLGRYQAPALLLQENAARILLEPIARFVPGADGVVDLYRMPAYDDIASLYLSDSGWNLHYMFPETPSVATIRDAASKALTKDSLREVLEEMKRNAD